MNSRDLPTPPSSGAALPAGAGAEAANNHPEKDVSPPDQSKPMDDDDDDSEQSLCLRWNNYQSNLTAVFDQLLQTEHFVDVTLSTEGRALKCHKVRNSIRHMWRPTRKLIEILEYV